MANLADLPSHVACVNCAMRTVCAQRAGCPDEPSPVDTYVRLAPGERLYGPGSAAGAVYAVRAGVLKLSADDGHGSAHIVRFLIPGDVAGLDALGGIHSTSAVALGDAEVCRFPSWRLEMLAEYHGRVRIHLRRLLAATLADADAHATSLARLRTEQRIARFLLSLADRWAGRGLPSRSFPLPMSRREIADHLAFTIGTASRLLSSLRRRGIIRLRPRSVEILKVEALRALASGQRRAASAVSASASAHATSA